MQDKVKDLTQLVLNIKRKEFARRQLERKKNEQTILRDVAKSHSFVKLPTPKLPSPTSTKASLPELKAVAPYKFI